jgi:hypothetical protein
VKSGRFELLGPQFDAADAMLLGGLRWPVSPCGQKGLGRFLPFFVGVSERARVDRAPQRRERIEAVAGKGWEHLFPARSSRCKELPFITSM